MAQAPETKTPTFTGTWDVESSENMDEYLDKSEGFRIFLFLYVMKCRHFYLLWLFLIGASWIIRKAAGVAGETNHLLHDPKEGVIRIRVNITGRPIFEYQIKLDGKTKVDYVDMDKKKITATATISEDGLVIREEQDRPESKESRWMTRELKDGKMISTFMNEAKKVSMKRIFKKKSDDSGLKLA
ncbi:hypothetical protein RFI_31390 [Reticulomyxa filosa]|uniref:Cytosolic fatty-acid binding proteins domain-containing protein n=1 Tax=Reticulomyxa filosa TaxID=46433 RepID=X6LVQ1_RETFI|nr:hypothetical protein RFI_31390 [Reticulomyxa filosa]|eukprot:ETO06008.1 hypothetical protein RFI_31390 [Reticulomyxa filosa]